MVQFYKNMFFAAKVTKDRYKDKTIFGFSSPQKVELDPYEGMATSVKFYPFAPRVYADGVLPSGVVGSASGFVAPQGKVYYIDTVANLQGDASIKEGIAFGFSESKHFRFGKKFPSVNKLLMTTRVKIDAENGVFFDNPSDKHLGLIDGKLALYDGKWTFGKTAIEYGKWYWIRAIRDGGATSYYLLTDQGYDLDTLPDTTAWTFEFSHGFNFFSNTYIDVGYNSHWTPEYFRGSIDLNNTVFDINGSRFWDKYTEGLSYLMSGNGILESGEDVPTSTDYTVFYKEPNILLSKSESVPNYIWVGNVTVPEHTNTEESLYGNFKEIGEVEYGSNGATFGVDSDIEADKKIPTKYFPEEDISFITRVRTPKTLSGQQSIFKTLETPSSFGINGNAWSLDGVTSGTVRPDTIYWVKVDGNTQLSVLEDNNRQYTDTTLPTDGWTKVVENQFSPFQSGNTFIIGRDWQGAIALEYTVLNWNKKLYWRAIS